MQSMHDTHTDYVGEVQSSIVMAPGSDDSQAEAGPQPEAAAANNFSIRACGDILWQQSERASNECT